MAENTRQRAYTWLCIQVAPSPLLDRYVLSTQMLYWNAGAGSYFILDLLPYLVLLGVVTGALTLTAGQEGMAGVVPFPTTLKHQSQGHHLPPPLCFLDFFQNIQEKMFIMNQLWAQPNAEQNNNNKKNKEWQG